MSASQRLEHGYEFTDALWIARDVAHADGEEAMARVAQILGVCCRGCGREARSGRPRRPMLLFYLHSIIPSH
eukprot:scaffold142647_cov35-Tisochrysis_lutea.AAC.3